MGLKMPDWRDNTGFEDVGRKTATSILVSQKNWSIPNHSVIGRKIKHSLPAEEIYICYSWILTWNNEQKTTKLPELMCAFSVESKTHQMRWKDDRWCFLLCIIFITRLDREDIEVVSIETLGTEKASLGCGFLESPLTRVSSIMIKAKL